MKIKEKIEEIKLDIQKATIDGGEKLKRVCEDHRDEIYIGTVIGVPVLAKVVTGVIKANKVRAAKCDHYDPVNFEHLESKRPLKPREKAEMIELMENGLSKYDALKRMGLLKK